MDKTVPQGQNSINTLDCNMKTHQSVLWLNVRPPGDRAVSQAAPSCCLSYSWLWLLLNYTKNIFWSTVRCRARYMYFVSMQFKASSMFCDAVKWHWVVPIHLAFSCFILAYAALLNGPKPTQCSAMQWSGTHWHPHKAIGHTSQACVLLGNRILTQEVEGRHW